VDWAEGRRTFPDPISFFLTSLVLAGTAGATVTRLLPGHAEQSALWEWTAGALRYAVPLLLSGLCHLVLRAGGSRRPFRATLAILLYLLGGPATLTALVGWAVVLAEHLLGVGPYLVATGIPGSSPVPLEPGALRWVGLLASGVPALAALGGVRWWWALLGITSLILLAAVLSGLASLLWPGLG
jgi:hypothetical protein